MLKASKSLKIVVFTLLTATLLMTAISLSPGANAATTSQVVVYPAIGIQTDPVAGTYNSYNVGDSFTITATPGDGFTFLSWTVAGASGAVNYIDNPLTIILNDSAYAIQANFQPTVIIPPATTATLASAAIVVILAGVGGTTSPLPGTYAISNATSMEITATASSGFTFSHWVIGGSPLSHGAYSFTDTPSNNPYNVNHGYGNTYTYQPVFNAISPATSPTPVAEFSSAAAIIIAAILIIVAFGTYTFSRRPKK